jgi:hypothetical protein
MKTNILFDIAKIRVCAGFLGEAHQYSWWKSQFFSGPSSAFLNPVFSKTTFLAQYYGVRNAAAIIHDEHIGIGKGVYHMFRLPEDIERHLHEYLSMNENIEPILACIKSKESAEKYIYDYGQQTNTEAIGPVRIGDTKDLSKTSSWQSVSHCYFQAFKNNSQVFPYFSESK